MNAINYSKCVEWISRGNRSRLRCSTFFQPLNHTLRCNTTLHMGDWNTEFKWKCYIHQLSFPLIIYELFACHPVVDNSRAGRNTQEIYPWKTDDGSSGRSAFKEHDVIVSSAAATSECHNSPTRHRIWSVIPLLSMSWPGYQFLLNKSPSTPNPRNSTTSTTLTTRINTLLRLSASLNIPMQINSALRLE